MFNMAIIRALPLHTPHVQKIQKFVNRQMQIQISEVTVQMQGCSCEALQVSFDVPNVMQCIVLIQKCRIC